MADFVETPHALVDQVTLGTIARNQCAKNLVKMVGDALDLIDAHVFMDTLGDIVKLITGKFKYRTYQFKIYALAI